MTSLVDKKYHGPNTTQKRKKMTKNLSSTKPNKINKRQAEKEVQQQYALDIERLEAQDPHLHAMAAEERHCAKLVAMLRKRGDKTSRVVPQEDWYDVEAEGDRMCICDTTGRTTHRHSKATLKVEAGTGKVRMICFSDRCPTPKCIGTLELSSTQDEPTGDEKEEDDVVDIERLEAQDTDLHAMAAEHGRPPQNKSDKSMQTISPQAVAVKKMVLSGHTMLVAQEHKNGKRTFKSFASLQTVRTWMGSLEDANRNAYMVDLSAWCQSSLTPGEQQNINSSYVSPFVCDVEWTSADLLPDPLARDRMDVLCTVVGRTLEKSIAKRYRC
jgi:hypothetical protein